MMKIAIVPFHSGMANNVIFDKNSESTNSDDLMTPIIILSKNMKSVAFL